ncbi:MAG: hypothetical protein ABIZ30_00090 [Candidatus Limnocylindrales bacterium]
MESPAGDGEVAALGAQAPTRVKQASATRILARAAVMELRTLRMEEMRGQAVRAARA